MQDLSKLERERIAAADRLECALKAQWPVGRTVKVMLHSRQQSPTYAEVIRHSGTYGTLTVQLFSKSRRGYRTVKKVHWRRVS